MRGGKGDADKVKILMSNSEAIVKATPAISRAGSNNDTGHIESK